ncbi:MAG: cytochrome c [Deltaproteobacteria bacterium]|nr:cytochrome c [Deltaproteobacteria bacterium]
MLAPLSRAVAALALLTCLMGHDHGCGAPDGTPTAARCDPRLRWDNFGRDFMTRYCTSCHGSTVRGGARHGAPTDHDLDTPEAIRTALDHIDLTAASGPGGTNTYMPPYGPLPTQREREDLGRWLACGAP